MKSKFVPKVFREPISVLCVYMFLNVIFSLLYIPQVFPYAIVDIDDTNKIDKTKNEIK